MPKYKIVYNRDGCIGCGSCAAVCPANWKLADDGKAKPLKTELNTIGCNQKAADSCPMQVIKIEKAAG